MRNRILHILTLALVAAGCAKEPLISTEEDGGIFVPQPVTVDFSVSVAEPNVETKALGEKPTINTLHVAVFNEEGYLCEYASCTFTAATENKTQYAYQVTLTSSDKARVLHFIANGPETLQYGTETNIIRNLTTTGKTDAYWQRIELTNILPVSAENLTLEPTSKAKIADVKLVRNFSKITITANPLQSTTEGTTLSNFKLLSFRLINEPKSGSVAPYNRTTSGFVNNYQDYADPAALSAAGYVGYEPVDTEIDTEKMGDEVKVTWVEDGKYTNNSAYLYEREEDAQTPTYVLVKGYYYKGGYTEGAAGTLCYYKVSLKDNKNKTIALLRNYNYKINILQVLTEGCASWEDAAATLGSGEISTSVEAEHLTNISNGKGRIFVEYTSKTLVKGGNVTLRYKFLPDESKGLIVNNNVQITKGEGSFITSITKAENDDSDGFRTVTLTVTEPTDSKQTQNLIIVGIDGDKNSIQRKVTYVLMPKQELLVDCIPEYVAKTTGTDVQVKIRIPGGLPTSMFPLSMTIEASQNSLTTNNDHQLPVRTGKSICPDKDDLPAFYYVRTISLDEYSTAERDMDEDGNCSFLSYFKTNTELSASHVCVYNDYFNYFADSATDYSTLKRHHSWDQFFNYDGGSFTNLEFSPAQLPVAEAQPFTFQFDLACSAQEVPETISVFIDGAYAEASQNPHLTYKSGNEYVYDTQYSGFSQSDITLNLKTSAVASTATVSLKANLIADNSATAEPKIAIASKILDLTGVVSEGAQVYVYDRQPSMAMIDNGSSQSLFSTAFTVAKDGTHYYLPEIDFTGKSVSTSTKLWFAYKGSNGYYYVANFSAGGDNLYDILALTENWKYKLNFTNEVPKEGAKLVINNINLKAKSEHSLDYTYNDNVKTGVNITFTVKSGDSSVAEILGTNGTYTINAKKAGTVTFTASVAATGTHEATSCDFTVTVTKKKRTMTISNVEMLSKAEAVPVVKLIEPDDNNKDVTDTGGLDGVISYSVPSSAASYFSIASSSEDKKGKITSDWGGLAATTVTATLPASDEYEESTATFTVKVDLRTRTLTATSSAVSMWSSSTMDSPVVFKKEGAEATPDEQVTYEPASVTNYFKIETTSTNKIGTITSDWGGLAATTVKASLPETHYYTGASETFTLAVNKRTRSLAIDDVSMLSSDTAQLSATLKDKTSGETLTIDKQLTYTYTPATGDGFKITFADANDKTGTVASDWGGQAYSVKASLDQDNYYAAVEKTFNVTTNKRTYTLNSFTPTSIEMDELADTQDITVTGSIDLTDRSLVFEYTKEGVCSTTYSTGKGGSFTIKAGSTGGTTTVTVKGDDHWYASTNSVTCTVRRIHWVQITDLSKITSGSIYMMTNTASTYAANNSSATTTAISSFNPELSYSNQQLSFTSTGNTNEYHISGPNSNNLIIAVRGTDAYLGYSSNSTQNWKIVKDNTGIYVTSEKKPYLRTYSYTIKIENNTFDVSNVDLFGSTTYVNIYKYNE